MKTPEFPAEKVQEANTFSSMYTLAIPEGDSTYAYDEGSVNPDSLFQYHLELEVGKQTDKRLSEPFPHSRE